MTWQPIETFAADGIHDGGRVLFARGELVWLTANPVRSLGQCQRHGKPPTHWMVIYPPPQETT